MEDGRFQVCCVSETSILISSLGFMDWKNYPRLFDGLMAHAHSSFAESSCSKKMSACFSHSDSLWWLRIGLDVPSLNGLPCRRQEC